MLMDTPDDLLVDLKEFIPALSDAIWLTHAKSKESKMMGLDEVSTRWEMVTFKLSGLLLLVKGGMLTSVDRK